MRADPFPERADASDASRFVELSVRKGWTVAGAAAAAPADRHAVLAVYALCLRDAEEKGGDALSAAKVFFAGPASFMKSDPEALLALARETGWVSSGGKLNAALPETLTVSRVEGEIEFSEKIRAEARSRMKSELQEKNRAVNRRPGGFEPALPEDCGFMREALKEAAAAGDEGEVPVGAVVVLGGRVIGRGRNRVIAGRDPTAHAEIEAMRDAAKNIGNYRLEDSALYVTLEPCPMCTGAAAHARISRVVFGASDPKAGAFGSATPLFSDPALHRTFRVTKGVEETVCRKILQAFFQKRREEKAS